MYQNINTYLKYIHTYISDPVNSFCIVIGVTKSLGEKKTNEDTISTYKY